MAAPSADIPSTYLAGACGKSRQPAEGDAGTLPCSYMTSKALISDEFTIDGKPQRPGAIASEAFEWSIPAIDGAANSTGISGSSAPDVNGRVGYMPSNV
jgi:hypothetical protein